MHINDTFRGAFESEDDINVSLCAPLEPMKQYSFMEMQLESTIIKNEPNKPAMIIQSV